MAISHLSAFSVLAEHMKPVLRVRIVKEYQAMRGEGHIPSSALLEHLLQHGMKRLKEEVDRCHGLQMSAQTSIREIVDSVLQDVRAEIQRETAPLLAQ